MTTKTPGQTILAHTSPFHEEEMRIALKEYGDQVRRETVEECRNTVKRRIARLWASRNRQLPDAAAKLIRCRVETCESIESDIAALLEGERQP